MLKEIRASGASILLMDNSISKTLGLSSREYVRSKGEVAFECESGEFIENDEVRIKYLEI